VDALGCGETVVEQYDNHFWMRRNQLRQEDRKDILAATSEEIQTYVRGVEKDSKKV
jgi:hypothetical protein